MDTKTFDLIVIGAGPGGYEAAFEAADLGMKTALVEKDAPGGTCLNRGCIPTKSFLHAAGLCREMREAAAFGIVPGEIKVDYARMQERKNEAVLQLRKGIEGTAARKKIALIRGTAALQGGGTVSVRTGEGEETLRADRILLATGSVPAVPPIPGVDLPGVLTSDGLLDNDKPIGRLVIIGGGVIGVEFAEVYAALGAAVTVIEAMPQLLPSLDREIAQSMKMLLKKRGVSVCTGTQVNRILPGEGGKLICEYGEAETAEADAVLVSVGRRPYTEGLFAPGAQPKTERGRITVNEYGETSLPGVWAVGDVTGGAMLAHAASAAGRNAVRRMAGLPPCADTRFIPSCVYTDPEIACAGMGEEEAKTAGIEADSRKIPMTANGKTVLTGAERGFIRVVFEKGSRRILGVRMMCERASDMIGEFTMALSMGLTMDEMARAVRPHPTFCEAITEALRLP
ncbi:MAG: dihydrolipoyl dehydrogenase [Clostridia bacterium]|nr:dihydrolipoyl dehydrogenase [Clostridia bacterium]